MSNYTSVFVRPFAVGGIIVNKKQTTIDAVLKNVLPRDDNRPYKERRLNPLYCFQDEAQGFIKRIVRPEPKPKQEQPKKTEEQKPKKAIDETNLEMSEISYKASAQVIRDYRWFEQEKDINQDFLINFGDSKMVAPKKKNRVIIC